MKKHLFFLGLIGYLPICAISQGVMGKQKILNDQIEILIPKSLHVMTEAEYKIKYPTPSRYPVIAFTDKNLEVNLLLRCIDDIPMTSDQLNDFKEQQLKMMQEKIPNARLLASGSETIHDSLLSFIKLITPTRDRPVRDYFFFTCLKGKLLMGTFNCVEDRWADWDQASKEIIRSITWL